MCFVDTFDGVEKGSGFQVDLLYIQRLLCLLLHAI
jgi:hypothetical protein